MVIFYPQIEWSNLPFYIIKWSNHKKLYLLRFTLNYKIIRKLNKNISKKIKRAVKIYYFLTAHSN